MSISNEFLLDDDGVSQSSLSLYNSPPPTHQLVESSNLKQIYAIEIGLRHVKSEMAFQKTNEKFQKYTGLSENEIDHCLKPVRIVTLEHEEYVNNLLGAFQKASEWTSSKWEEERNEHNRKINCELKFSDYLFDKKGIISIEELDEEFQIAERDHDASFAYKQSFEAYKDMHRKLLRKFVGQKSELEEYQKKCAELEAQNQKLKENLDAANATIRDISDSEKKVSRKRTVSISVQTVEDSDDSKTIDLIKKLCFPLFSSSKHTNKTVMEIPVGMKSERKLYNYSIVNDLLCEGQGVTDMCIVKDDSIMDFGNPSETKSGCEESANGPAEDSSVIMMCCGEKQTGTGCVQECPTANTHENCAILDIDEDWLKVVELPQKISKQVYESQFDVLVKENVTNDVIECFNVLNECREELIEQSCEVFQEHSEENDISYPLDMENQVVVKESECNSRFTDTIDTKCDKVEQKSDDIVKCQSFPQQLLRLPSEENFSQNSDNHQNMVLNDHSSSNIKVDTSKFHNKPGFQKQGDVACGVDILKKIKRRMQEEYRPRTDPPTQLTVDFVQVETNYHEKSIAVSNDQYTSVSNQVCSENSLKRYNEEPHPRKDPDSSHWSETKDSRINKEPYPRKDPPNPRSDVNDTKVHQEYLPRKDPPKPCHLQYANWTQWKGLHLPSTATWSNYVFAVH